MTVSQSFLIFHDFNTFKNSRQVFVECHTIWVFCFVFVFFSHDTNEVVDLGEEYHGGEVSILDHIAA